MSFDPITTLNLILALAVFVMGFVAFRKTKDLVPLCISIAFGLFALSHIITLSGMGDALLIPSVIFRVIAYASSLYAVYTMALAKPAKAEGKSEKRKK